jgi:hypothetical protein
VVAAAACSVVPLESPLAALAIFSVLEPSLVVVASSAEDVAVSLSVSLVVVSAAASFFVVVAVSFFVVVAASFFVVEVLAFFVVEAALAVVAAALDEPLGPL